MIIEQLLGDVPTSVFIDEYYLKLPFSRAGQAGGFAHLGSWEIVEQLLAEPAADVLVARQGELDRGVSSPSFGEARALYEAGCTVLVRHAERHEPRLAALAEGFRQDFQAPVDIHVYCTPPGQYGFGWHYDAEEVFILQAEGRKEYSLRKNTVNPWPLVETLPADMAYEREIMPLVRCALEAGDWLYIPAGYWHRAEARTPAISLAVGLLPPAALDVFDFLRPRLLSSLVWRQRLPPAGKASACGPEETLARYRALFEELGRDLAKTMRGDEFVRSFLERAVRRAAADDRFTN